MSGQSKKLRIVVFAPDIPYPANRGGRADIWRRIEAFRKLGHEVMLVNLQEPDGPNQPSIQSLQHIDSVVNRRFSFLIKRGLRITVRQLANCYAVPWHAANRVPTYSEKETLFSQIIDFSPDFLWMDGPWFSIVCNELAEILAIPILYRSHNVEYLYLRGQAQAAIRFRDRLAWRLACIGMRRFETQAIQRAAAVFDISVDDLQYWKNAGVMHMYWLPPLPELAFGVPSTKPVSGDLVFVGNLGTPNNVRGVQWLVSEVFPKVQVQFPNVSCRVVGSNPTPFIRELLKNVRGVELCANVPDTTAYLFGAKVLVNPVMTGSGVQVKMLDMLMTDAPIVTASQGTRGLPADFQRLFRIADDPDSFARAICEELTSSSVDVGARAAAREVFSVAAVGQALDQAVAERRANAAR